MAIEVSACFFYGTLMNAKILSRVIGRDSSDLDVRPAILPDHTRHHVASVDYPGVVRADLGRAVMGRDLTEDESRVRGTVVRGLNQSDIEVLDLFEGDEYERRPCVVHLATEDGALLPETVPVTVYLWTAPASRLRPILWSYDAFVKDHLRFWVNSSEEGDRYAEVDQRMAMEGKITPPEHGDDVEFGHALRDKYWSFEPGYINLNHGSFGTCPKPVLAAFRSYQDEAEAAPDKFFRRNYIPLLDACRREIGTLVNCDSDDVVMVPNATHGVYTVFHSIQWEPNDQILYFPTSVYNACANVMHNVIDRNPHLDLSLLPVQLTYPCSAKDVLEATKKTLNEAKKDGKGKVKIALVDAISSQPGVVVPWEKLTRLLKEEGVLVCIDAAHALGSIRVDLKQAQPDFWISNAHKWLFVHRGCAALYVAKEHQQRVHSVPIGHAYPVKQGGPNAHKVPGAGASTFLAEFAWPGTQDFSALSSVPAAMAFRRRIGGESAIRTWCHELARQGGRKVAEIWGTEVMESGDGDLTGTMVNVRLPLEWKADTVAEDRDVLTWALMDEFNCFAPSYVHDKKWWTRFSAQVYNELSDFEYVAKSLSQLVDRINLKRKGEVQQ